ncbi:DUF885 domain-containing protein [bacterium]|nr:DUF885 domain-containing protein [bacterium]
MIKQSFLLSLAIIFMQVFFVNAQTPTENEVQKMHKIFDEEWEFGLQRYPTNATYNGDHRFDDKLEDLSEKALLEDLNRSKQVLEKIKKINYEILPENEKVNYLLYKTQLEEGIEYYKYKTYLMPIGQQGGIHIGFAEIQGYSRFETVSDYENYIKRMNGFPKQIDDTIERMKKGVREKIVPPQKIMEKVLPQIQAQIAEDPTKSIIFEPATKFPDTFSEEQKAELTQKLKDAITKSIMPSNKKLYDFIEKDYLPGCRKEFGIWSLPNGNDYYTYLAKSYTTTNLTPQQIFELGESELARIRKEMEKIKEQVAFEGSLDEFIVFVRNDPKFYAKSGDELMAGFGEILVKMDKKLPDFFNKLPQKKYGLREIEEFRAVSAPVAYYYPPPEDGSRPGYFYVNTTLPEKRATYTMEALAFHEAVPGHHLQIALAQELKNLPKFRQHGGATAFVEGWGLYAEGLGKEAGFYQSPYSDYGRLTFEAWRAVRLIVDTGMHYFKWTREDAIEFCKKNLSLAEVDIVSEVERYISTPGQALAYKIGELKIRELRKKAENKLGKNFDLKEFHDVILKNGAVPLNVLEKIIDEWVASKS